MHVTPRLAALLEAFNHPSLPGIDLSLERVEQLLEALGNPERKVPPTIHVAGTNGKGSTIAFMKAMLEAWGKRVHVYTSPHLVTFNERIALAGAPIADDALIAVLERVREAAREIPVTFFEATTAAAFLAFSESEADYLLLEVGMGGRLDATNLITPIASVITPIAIDHAEFLGSDLTSIAREKAGIIKNGVPVIIAKQEPAVMHVLEETALRHGARLSIADAPDYVASRLEGAHQRANAALAIAALQAVTDIPDSAIAKGLAHVHWPARLQKLTQGLLAPCWLDGAHNAHAAKALAAWAALQPKPLVLVTGLMVRKDASAFFAQFKSVADAVITVPIPGAEDASDPKTLAEVAQAAGLPAEVAGSLPEAAEAIKRYKPATVLVAGSLYLAGEVLKTHD